MSKYNKNERVSVSFHFLERKDAENDGQIVAITQSEFDSVYAGLDNLLKDNGNETPEKTEELKAGNLVIVKRLEKLNNRQFCGIFENSYWGHSFRNSKKGEIAADSLNYRPFFFLMYLAESGKVYLACQYLGNYGGYSAMKHTVAKVINNNKNLTFCSFNMFLAQMDKLVPTEVLFDVYRRAKTINGKNTQEQKIAITLKLDAGATTNQLEVQNKILPLLGKPQDKIRAELSKFMTSSELMSINDDELSNCRVIAKINDSTTTIHLLDESNFATKFPVTVDLDNNGHPIYEKIKSEALKLLSEKIITGAEDV